MRGFAYKGIFTPRFCRVPRTRNGLLPHPSSVGPQACLLSPKTQFQLSIHLKQLHASLALL